MNDLVAEAIRRQIKRWQSDETTVPREWSGRSEWRVRVEGQSRSGRSERERKRKREEYDR